MKRDFNESIQSPQILWGVSAIVENVPVQPQEVAAMKQ